MYDVPVESYGTQTTFGSIWVLQQGLGEEYQWVNVLPPENDYELIETVTIAEGVTEYISADVSAYKKIFWQMVNPTSTNVNNINIYGRVGDLPSSTTVIALRQGITGSNCEQMGKVWVENGYYFGEVWQNNPNGNTQNSKYGNSYASFVKKDTTHTLKYLIMDNVKGAFTIKLYGVRE